MFKGFDSEEISSALAKSRAQGELFLASCRSVPLSITEMSDFKQQVFLVMDNDSGYASNNADSNSNSLLESSLEQQPQHIFISEDALLEKPDVQEVSMIMETSGEDEEYSHLFYTSGMEDDEAGGEKNCPSEASELSTIITPIKPIETTVSLLNSLLKAASSSKNNTVSTPKQIVPDNDYFIIDDKACIANVEINKECQTLVSEPQPSSTKTNFLHSQISNAIASTWAKSEMSPSIPSTSTYIPPTNLGQNFAQPDQFINNDYVIVCDLPIDNIASDATMPMCIPTTSAMETIQFAAPTNCEHLTTMDTIASCSNVVSQDNDRELVSEICTSLLNNPMLEGPLMLNRKGKEIEKLPDPATPEKYGKRKREEPTSPDLFSDEESFQESDSFSNITMPTQTRVQDEKYINKNDKRLLRRVREGVSGVLPPPSLTTVNLTVAEMLNKISQNQEYFVDPADVVAKQATLDESTASVNSEAHNDTMNNSSIPIENRKKTLLVTTTLENCLSLRWPWVLEERYHGLHYNRGKVSEEFELLCAKYGQRFVGGETQSTCTVFNTINLSPTKRKAAKLRWVTKSPGRRLSHLAKRRITFSSASLQAGSSVMSAHARQILVDSRKMQMLARRKSPRKTPSKKTPRKSPKKKMRTPSSSVKKQMAKSLDLFAEEDQVSIKPSTSVNRVQNTKRALFQSPESSKAGPSSSKHIAPSTSGNASVSPFIKKSTPRALFLSPKKSPRKSPHKRNLFEAKRKRCESGDELHPAKIPRRLALASNDAENQPVTSSRVSALSAPSHHVGELSAHHKKKLQWAVFEALKSQNIGNSNPNFKQYASTLARVTRRFLPNLSANAPRPEGGTSDRMLRIARQHVFAVIKGKTVDEIVQEVQKNRQKNVKPTGYVALEQENPKPKEICSSSKSRDTVLQDKANILNSMDKSKTNSSSVKVKTPRVENRVDRVRKVIKFDDDGQNEVV